MGIVDDAHWMREALLLAQQAQAQHEVPVGAVIVLNNTLIAKGYNTNIQHHDPTAHAEIMALRAAGYALANHRLTGTTLYVTLEPCAMCAAAIMHARIKRVVFATRDLNAGAAGSVYNLLHHVQIDEGLLNAESAQLLINFFKAKRM
ncbi:MAG: tRNA adenosine(34) deaminase TadA [Legionellaceae bacterium]|nr:tRNA adenosine(34) deaminase TadA [Legionellaceae bacterium]HAF87953.1 tRNA adenosine(34) deaminase TadA [Legionellales bacterium]HCA89119.1 tRNA adenosine(34) deaminase TadA [Legionellales bacterium]|tara:strand:+ start:3188 stop:3628 length:441 start_codon:yes stop_codon:yes gene_type:complete